MSITVYFVRHGESVANVRQGGEGFSNDAEHNRLTELGKKQVQKLGKRLAGEDITQIITSQLSRAQETAEIISDTLKVPVETLPYIQEYNESDEYFVTGCDIRKGWPSWMAKSKPDYAPPGAESFNEIVGRVKQLERHLISLGPDKHILVVGHGTFLRFFLGHTLLQKSFDTKLAVLLLNAKTTNTGISTFNHLEEVDVVTGKPIGWQLMTWMDHAHL